jgi:arylsulfatase
MAASAVALSMALGPTVTLAEPAPAPAPAAQQWRNYPTPPRAPKDAPNVLLIMTDDVGFAVSSTFGGPIPTPTFDALAAHGLRYNNFHTTAMCSPTRAALLTGRNHHSVASGVIADFSTDDPGYTSIIPASAATIAEVLHENGYATSFFGKNHNTPRWETSPLGPFDRWPNGWGFDYFYGFNAALTDQFAPQLVENRNLVDPPHSPDYILDKDMADHAVRWLQLQHTVAPSSPFFLYYAPGSMHSPHQAPKAWIEKFKGRFDQGWDKLREETFARQKAMGIIPAKAELTPRPPQIPAWSSLSPDERKVAERLMEDAAAQLAYCDDQIGRIIEALRQSGQLDNTLIIFLQGDNGASGENFSGSRNDAAAISGIEGDTAQMLAHLDELGGPRSYENYPVGWAMAMDTPFQWSKEVASHFGGTRNGMVVSWPRRINGHGEVRSQFHHVIDVAPTVYEAAGITPPASVHGVAQQPIEGVSMAYTFDHPDAPSTHTSQYFEMLGNRAFYKDGWIASTTPGRMPWSHVPAPNGALTYKWELYDLHSDFTQAHDLAAKRPDKLKELQADFDAAAARFNILPLNDDALGRLAPGMRPSLMAGRGAVTYYPSPVRYPDSTGAAVGPNWRLVATVQAPGPGASGAIAQRGGWASGWSLVAQDGRPVFTYRASEQDGDTVQVAAPQALAPGRHEIEVDVSREPGPGLRPGTAVMKVDGAAVGQAAIRRAVGAGGELYVGRAGLTPVSDHDPLPQAYPGVVEKLVIEPNAK